MKGKKPNHGRGTALAESVEFQGIRIKGRLWVEKQGETFLGWGRVVLLERTCRATGSIATAARAMKMAYSHAWSLVANLNDLAGEELVSRSFGGRNGGRAWLTPGGRGGGGSILGFNGQLSGMAQPSRIKKLEYISESVILSNE